MTETEAHRRQAITRIGTYLPWRRDWLPRDIEEYHRALEDLTPTAVDHAITEAMRTRRTIPSASQLREIAATTLATERAAQRETRRFTNPDGPGCPTCRHTGETPDWIGDGNLITCTRHNTMWPGRGHQLDQLDPGELTPEGWHRNAINGRYGTTLQHLAENGAGPTVALRKVSESTDLQAAIAGEMRLA